MEISYEDLVEGKENEEQRAQRMYDEIYTKQNLDHLCTFEWYYEHIWKPKE